jgi:glycine hydroxymethyltransferase
MSLTHDGHLTHGSKVSFSGKSYNFIPYGVNRETERIDYEQVERLARKHKPKLIIAGASAYPRIIDFERFRHIADLVEAKLLVDTAHTAGMIAAGLHPTPVPYADVITATTHKTLRGPRGGFILCRRELAKAIDAAVFPEMQGSPMMHIIAAKAVAFLEAMQPDFYEYQKATLDNALVLADELMEAVGIITNRNVIPSDSRPATITSGIRPGTPAVTTRGFGAEEMKLIASLIVRVITNIGNRDIQNQAR